MPRVTPKNRPSPGTTIWAAILAVKDENGHLAIQGEWEYFESYQAWHACDDRVLSAKKEILDIPDNQKLTKEQESKWDIDRDCSAWSDAEKVFGDCKITAWSDDGWTIKARVEKRVVQ